MIDATAQVETEVFHKSLLVGAQVIVLSTDEEVNGQYLEQLREHIGTFYTLKYDEAAKSTSILPGYFGEELV